MSVPMAARTILVVDDEEVVRILIARALTEAGYRVIQATHGGAALAVLEREDAAIDLVVCDLVMPAVDGRDVARWLTAHRPDVPILLDLGLPGRIPRGTRPARSQHPSAQEAVPAVASDRVG